MIHYNTKATFKNFENTNKSKVDCAMIQNKLKKEEEKKHTTHTHTQNKKQKHAIKIKYIKF